MNGPGVPAGNRYCRLSTQTGNREFEDRSRQQRQVMLASTPRGCAAPRQRLCRRGGRRGRAFESVGTAATPPACRICTRLPEQPAAAVVGGGPRGCDMDRLIVASAQLGIARRGVEQPGGEGACLSCAAHAPSRAGSNARRREALLEGRDEPARAGGGAPAGDREGDAVALEPPPVSPGRTGCKRRWPGGLQGAASSPRSTSPRRPRAARRRRCRKCSSTWWRRKGPQGARAQPAARSAPARTTGKTSSPKSRVALSAARVRAGRSARPARCPRGRGRGRRLLASMRNSTLGMRVPKLPPRQPQRREPDRKHDTVTRRRPAPARRSAAASARAGAAPWSVARYSSCPAAVRAYRAVAALEGATPRSSSKRS